ncbi:hypothetical protein ATK17_3782 [Branchiibius hedensis]|uniref:Uncharacterized protein n=1 Tax=Branchiibius hedensis TaxID=672460 RepID=A0A2Y9BMP0_9MICO|nr:hypothetical protein [Branchiibius hedensis]PWJ23289.1 hypothetical protein ATK17_3782 [Branchiibius hedensis]SSA58978.1 hypothetical protein SAMN04489750_3782 [Branchiibius hedensis]
MGKQTIKQEARRAALDAQSKRREERAERERRLERLAIEVLVAVREREAAVLDADRRAGKALIEMIETERLSAREAVQWCGDELSAREVARLRRVAADAADAAAEGDADSAAAASKVPTEAAPESVTADDATESPSVAS